MHIIEALVLLILANGTPVLAGRVLGRVLAWPLDGGVRFVDGRRLLGDAKTLRGVIVAVAATALGAPAMGMSWRLGALVGSVSMCGDLCSSFIKRRLAMPPSTRATGLDQIPESLLPLLLCREALGLTVGDIVVVVALFMAGGIFFSPLFYRLRIRKRPY